jgi:hypothetical protein
MTSGCPGFALDDISIFNIGTSSQPSYVDFDSTTEETKTLTLNSIKVPISSSGNAYVYVVVISTVKNFIFNLQWLQAVKIQLLLI